MAVLAGVFFWLPLAGLAIAVLSGILAIVGIIVGLVRRGAGLGFSVAALLLSLLVATFNYSLIRAIDSAAHTLGSAMKEAVTPELDRSEHKEVGWTDATQRAAVSGNLSMKFIGARVAPLKLTRLLGEEYTTDSKYLIIEVQIENRSTTRKLDYVGGGSTGSDGIRLTDDIGNQYRCRAGGFGLEAAKGQVRFEAVYPGQRVTDSFAFEPPVNAARELRLEIAGSRLGSAEPVRLRIPTSVVKRPWW